MSANVSNQCYTSTYYQYTVLLLVPLLILLLIIIPGIMFAGLYNAFKKGN